MQPSQTVKIHHQAITTSCQIAKVFKKPHSDVLKDIDKLLGQIDDELIKCHFKPAFKMKYINYTQYKMPYYILSKDGFTLLMMSNKTYGVQSKIDPIFVFNQPQKSLTKTHLSSIERFYGLCLDFKNIFKVLSLIWRIIWIIDKIIQIFPPIM